MNIERYRGNTYNEVLVLKVDGVPVLLSTLTSITFLFSKDGNVTTIPCIKDEDLSSGIVRVPFLANQTDNIGIHRYEVVAVDDTGAEITFAVGTLNILPGVNII